MKGSIYKILDRIFVVLGAFLFSLFPLFIQQYQQQLVGHVNELRWQIRTMQNVAAESGKDLDQYIQKFIDHSDKDFSRQGAMMKLIINRWNRLSSSLLRLQHSTIITRPFIFIFYLEWDIFKSTVSSFQTGFSFTLETCLYAFAGMMCGYIFCYGLLLLWEKITRSKLDPSTRNLHKKGLL